MYINKLFRLVKSDHTGIQFFRYSLVGIMGISADYISLFFLTEIAGVYYLFSAALAFLVGLVINYLLGIKWVFNRRSLKNNLAEFGVYASLGIVGLIMNETIIWFFTEIFSFHYLISKTFYIVIYILIFFVRKKLLFK